MQTCVGCGKSAPETDTNYTLISAQFGWRLTRVKRDDGSITLEWRCPSCWRDYKRVRGAAGAPEAHAEPALHPPTEPSSSTGLAPRSDTAVRRRPTAAPVDSDARHAPSPLMDALLPRRPGRTKP